MTTHKAFALLYFLLCFCFLSTSYAQPCLAETDLTNEYNYQFSLEESLEETALLNSNSYIKPFDHATQLFKVKPVENHINHTLPCCNRGPPSNTLIKQQPILAT
ncbi:hypothetical protein CPS_2791 [Colwellia psychrerythraea 34H]|uniref:Uncharacterized protein n=1 Tax=Colwellia psychrerythraea (strain 34H / ATCC BAA-681) TaxID=167879 RepID=Q480L6_COLP3|nr:hypothetical protein CPS_2791 [Colwellia psychrerythraea 34H]